MRLWKRLLILGIVAAAAFVSGASTQTWVQQQSNMWFHGVVAFSDSTIYDEAMRTTETILMRETGASPQYYATIQGGDQSADITLTLPTVTGTILNSTDPITITGAIQHGYTIDSDADFADKEYVDDQVTDISRGIEDSLALINGTDTIWVVHNGTVNLKVLNSQFDLDDDLQYDGGELLVNDTGTRTQMTNGISIFSAGVDDLHFAIENSDVGHGLTTGGVPDVQTTDYFVIEKQSDTAGGARLASFSEETGFTSMRINAYGGDGEVTQTTLSLGLMHLFISEHDGSNSTRNPTAETNMFAIARSSSACLFIVTEDGDFFYDGIDGGSFDVFDDAGLLRTFARSSQDRAGLVESVWDAFVSETYQDLIDIGLVDYVSPEDWKNGVRPLVNGAVLNRLLIGAAWQNRTYIRDLEQAVAQNRAQIDMLVRELYNPTIFSSVGN